uniref:CBS domain-containing protein n=1 Tax=Thermorudis sp. TaxID=1969470 RepID=A0A7C2WHK0_9BACT
MANLRPGRALERTATRRAGGGGPATDERIFRQEEAEQPFLGRADADPAGAIAVHQVVGSIEERTLLDRVYRRPEAIHERIGAVMDLPFPLVDRNEEVERIFPLLSSGAPAVLVEERGTVVGIVTRSDLLSFVAHRNEVTP